jgi:DNA-binding transcriptional LysR family regulator
MINIPTDLLRTLVAVVDLRSFTKAAASLGVTQPAVSAQIKRLQYLLGVDLFDRSAQGFSLTPQGEQVVSYARRMLSINDHIVHLGGAAPRSELMIRIGTPSDHVASIMPGMLAQFRQHWPDVRFTVRTDFHEPLMRDLRRGDLDLYVGLTMGQPHDAHHSWAEEVVWVGGAATRFDSSRPVPLVSFGEPCIYRRLATETLKSADLAWEDVFIGPSLKSLHGAVDAGLGVMAIIRRRAVESGMIVWKDAPLPRPPELYCGVYIREGGTTAVYEHLADQIAAELRASPACTARLVATAGTAQKTNTAA